MKAINKVTINQQINLLRKQIKNFRGKPCRKYTYYFGEYLTSKWLSKHKIPYWYGLALFKPSYNQHIDFLIPVLNIGIEVDGRQHKQLISGVTTKKELALQILNDTQKNLLCLFTSIKLIHIKSFRNTSSIMRKLLYKQLDQKVLPLIKSNRKTLKEKLTHYKYYLFYPLHKKTLQHQPKAIRNRRLKRRRYRYRLHLNKNRKYSKLKARKKRHLYPLTINIKNHIYFENHKQRNYKRVRNWYHKNHAHALYHQRQYYKKHKKHFLHINAEYRKKHATQKNLHDKLRGHLFHSNYRKWIKYYMQPRVLKLMHTYHIHVIEIIKNFKENHSTLMKKNDKKHKKIIYHHNHRLSEKQYNIMYRKKHCSSLKAKKRIQERLTHSNYKKWISYYLKPKVIKKCKKMHINIKYYINRYCSPRYHK